MSSFHVPALIRYCGRLVVCAIALAAPSAALSQTWVPVGPGGGDVRSLGYDPRDPRRIYLGTADGVLYRSDDGGLSWGRLSPGFPLRGRSIDDLVVDARGVVLAGYWEVSGSGGGVARSLDGGVTFELLPGIDGQAVRALAQAPSDPRTLVVGTLSGVLPLARRRRQLAAHQSRGPSRPAQRGLGGHRSRPTPRRSTSAPGTCRGRRATAGGAGRPSPAA